MTRADAPEPMEFDVSRKLTDSIGDLLGAELAGARDGWSLVRLRVEERHLNPFGFVNGTVGFALCDIGMGSAIATEMLKRKTSSATVEIKINYLKSVRGGLLECESRTVHLGTRLATMESDVRCDGELVIKATGTFALLELTGEVLERVGRLRQRPPSGEGAAR